MMIEILSQLGPWVVLFGSLVGVHIWAHTFF